MSAIFRGNPGWSRRSVSSDFNAGNVLFPGNATADAISTTTLIADTAFINDLRENVRNAAVLWQGARRNWRGYRGGAPPATQSRCAFGGHPTEGSCTRRARTGRMTQRCTRSLDSKIHDSSFIYGNTHLRGHRSAARRNGAPLPATVDSATKFGSVTEWRLRRD